MGKQFTFSVVLADATCEQEGFGVALTRILHSTVASIEQGRSGGVACDAEGRVVGRWEIDEVADDEDEHEERDDDIGF